jgi:hypothetical protein
MIPRKEFFSSSEIPMISFSNIIIQLNPVIGLGEKILTIDYAPVGRSNLLNKGAEDNAEFYNQILTPFSYHVIDYRHSTADESPKIRFYCMLVSLIASNIVLIFQALNYTGDMIAN